MSMWRDIARKAKDATGVSFVIALVFLLIATMVVATVLASASTSATRYKQHAEAEQSYYSVVSALNIADDLITKDTAIGRLSLREDYDGKVMVLNRTKAVDEDLSGMAEWAADTAKSIHDGAAGSSGEAGEGGSGEGGAGGSGAGGGASGEPALENKATWDVTTTLDGQSIDPVTLTLSMSNDLTITVEARAATADGADPVYANAVKKTYQLQGVLSNDGDGAHWGTGLSANARTITVTFDGNGGTLNGSTTATREIQNVEEGRTADFSGDVPVFTRTGYTRDSQDWYFAPEGGTPVDLTKVSSDIEVFAHWTANVHTLTFNLADGNIDGDERPIQSEVSYGDPITPPTNPVREGYDFIGWDITVPTTMPDEDVTATAQWQVHEHTLTFDFDGGTLAGTEQRMVAFGTEVADPGTPDKTGYTFVRWEPTLPVSMPDSDLTVKAIYERNEYTVRYEYGYTGAAEPYFEQTVPYGDSIPQPADDPTRDDGYLFDGWDSDLPETMPDHDVTVKAKWKLKEYTITFDFGGGVDAQGKTSSEVTVEHGAIVTAPTVPGDFAREGYQFNGWTPEVVSPVTEDATYTAQWNVTVTFDYNYGADDPDKTSEPAAVSVNVAEGGALAASQVPDPAGSREDYDFMGWQSTTVLPARTLSVDEVAALTFNANDGFKAIWLKNKATATFYYGYDKDENGSADDATEITKAVNQTTRKADMSTEVNAIDTNRSGYAFLGWFTAAEDGTEVTEFSAVEDGAEYYAHWNQQGKTFTLTFHANGGTFGGGDAGSETVVRIVTVEDADATTADFTAVAPTAPTRSGYRFTDWRTTSSGEQKVNLSNVADTVVDVYAHWVLSTKSASDVLKADTIHTDNDTNYWNLSNVTGWDYLTSNWFGVRDAADGTAFETVHSTYAYDVCFRYGRRTEGSRNNYYMTCIYNHADGQFYYPVAAQSYSAYGIAEGTRVAISMTSYGSSPADWFRGETVESLLALETSGEEVYAIYKSNSNIRPEGSSRQIKIKWVAF